MKKIYTTIAFLLFTYVINAQNSKINSSYLDSIKISYVTPNRDTLYLINDELGKTIYDIWQKDQNKPIILFIDDKKLMNLYSSKK